ncbi:MAG: MFS transporter [Acidobacteria bacterium]|nr:MFS transporter [Acidobacteriota bacterium]
MSEPSEPLARPSIHQPFLARFRVVTRALRHRNFRLFISGQFLSLIGTWVQMVAQSWLVYRLSQSPVMLGLVGFAGQIPYLVLAPVAGVVADRMNLRRLILITQTLAMLQAFLLAGLTLTGTVQVWQVFYLALALGVTGIFDMTARQSFLVQMVGKEDLMNAIALNSSVFNSGRILGPAVAGVLVAALGEGYCFVINGSTFLALIGGLLMMRLPPWVPQAEAVSPWHHFREGWDYVRHHAPSRALLIHLGIVSIMNYPFLVLMPVFADRILHGGPRALGILMSSVGVGAILGSLYMASRTGLRGLSRTITQATLAYSAALILFAFSPFLYLSSLVLMVAGFGMMLQVASTNTTLQTITPDALRGRVVSFYSMMFQGMLPIGSLMAGWLGELIGPRYAVALGAAVCIVAALVFNRKRPVVRAALLQVTEQKADMLPVPAPVARSGQNSD